MIPLGAGLYVFTRDRATLSPQNTLYVGKADGGKQTLKGRVSTYISLFRNPKTPASNHAAKRKLLAYYIASPDRLFVRWTGVVVARELEGTLIAMLDPDFQGKDEHREPFFETGLIPEEMLYEAT